VTNDYTLRYRGKMFQIDRLDIRVGMRKAMVRVEERLDGTIAVRFQDKYVRVRRCAPLVGRPSDSLSDNPSFHVGIGPAERASMLGIGSDVSH
jgi:hypothetical protein